MYSLDLLGDSVWHRQDVSLDVILHPLHRSKVKIPRSSSSHRCSRAQGRQKVGIPRKMGQHTSYTNMSTSFTPPASGCLRAFGVKSTGTRRAAVQMLCREKDMFIILGIESHKLSIDLPYPTLGLIFKVAYLGASPKRSVLPHLLQPPVREMLCASPAKVERPAGGVLCAEPLGSLPAELDLDSCSTSCGCMWMSLFSWMFRALM